MKYAMNHNFQLLTFNFQLMKSSIPQFINSSIHQPGHFDTILFILHKITQ